MATVARKPKSKKKLQNFKIHFDMLRSDGRRDYADAYRVEAMTVPQALLFFKQKYVSRIAPDVRDRVKVTQVVDGYGKVRFVAQAK